MPNPEHSPLSNLDNIDSAFRDKQLLHQATLDDDKVQLLDVPKRVGAKSSGASPRLEDWQGKMPIV